MEHYAAEVVDGMALVMAHVGAKVGTVGVKKKYTKSIAALEAAIEGRPNLNLHLLNNFYPSGDEQILVTEVTGRVVPEGGIPLQVGVVVSNVASLVNVSRAARNKVVVDKEVTLVGELEEPQVVGTPVGTPIRHLMALARPTRPLDELVVIDGGPMMGKLVSLDGYINKKTSGLIVLPKDHPLVTWKQIPMASMIRRSAAVCCQCRDCTEVCSRYMQGHRIEPHKMMRGLGHPQQDHGEAMLAAFLCSQCGLCEFACPLNLSPKMAYEELLGQFRARGVKSPFNNAPERVHEFNRYRKIDKNRLIRRYHLTKYDSHDLPLTFLPSPPPLVGLELGQAIGAPSEAVVRVGDRISRGSLVAAAPEGKLGANLHASIDGRISRVDAGKLIVIEGD
jgi:Na+-translocating ferredoxin:NAD+ oxidoreductase RnfC subunit